MILSIAASIDGSAAASDFKSLLADAGSLVFGDDEAKMPVAPAPPAPDLAVAGMPPATNDRPELRLAQRADGPKQTPDGRAAAKADPPKIDAAKTGRDADAILQRLLPPRSDTPADWHAAVECLHAPGEPRALRPCVPPPPCDPSEPPHPFDLVGVAGEPTCGPIYRGPCQPRAARHHEGIFGWYHHACDRAFDHFYRSK